MNKKNIKKLIRLHICSIITLLATDLICAERKRKQDFIQYNAPKKPFHEKTFNLSQSYIYYFTDIDTPHKYDTVAAKLENKKSTKNVTIICNLCSSQTKGKFHVARNNMHNHMQNKHNFNTRDSIYTQQKIAPFNFKSMNTQKKYDEIVSYLPQGENTLVQIHCNMCNEMTRGLLPFAYINIERHRKSRHFDNK